MYLRRRSQPSGQRQTSEGTRSRPRSCAISTDRRVTPYAPVEVRVRRRAKTTCRQTHRVVHCGSIGDEIDTRSANSVSRPRPDVRRLCAQPQPRTDTIPIRASPVAPVPARRRRRDQTPALHPIPPAAVPRTTSRDRKRDPVVPNPSARQIDDRSGPDLGGRGRRRPRRGDRAEVLSQRRTRGGSWALTLRRGGPDGTHPPRRRSSSRSWDLLSPGPLSGDTPQADTELPELPMSEGPGRRMLGP
jgi:hypothetical protein